MPRCLTFRRRRPVACGRSVVLAMVAGPFFVSAGVTTTRAVTPSLSAVTGGTWSGTSTCVGNRPACRNETVVYRFVPVEGIPTQTRLLADKIIEGKRVPMYALVFEYDAREGRLRCEFTWGHTHGVWWYAVTGDSIRGELVVLPDSSVGRRVVGHRVKEDRVPPAPAIAEYDE